MREVEITVDLVEVQGQCFAIVDIGMRMLTPRELANCQGFPSDYVLKGTKTKQIQMIGNSVPPHVIEAIVAANLKKPESVKRRKTHRKATFCTSHN